MDTVRSSRQLANMRSFPPTNLACTSAVLRTGWIMTLHPSEGRAGKPESALWEPFWHQRDRAFGDFVGKPDDYRWNRPSGKVGLMALLDESNLLAERARHAKFRTNHVGTKLNEAELQELTALVAKRKETPAELIRGLVLREIAQDKQPTPEVRASVEMEEIVALRLLLINVLPKLAVGEHLTLEAYKQIETEVQKRKSIRGLELVQEWQKRGITKA
jgi:hypothetical protein